MPTTKVYFIKGADVERPLMEEAFLACKSQQIETLSCNIAEFTKDHMKQFKPEFKPNLRNIVVTDNFTGDDFDKLKELENTRLVGPLCILACLNEGISIPNCKWPLLNIAMKGAVVCCSGISKENKAKIRELVILMNGDISSDYLENTSHLITDNVVSVKYALAAASGKNIMTPSWIEAIWNESQSRVVRYDNEQFHKYKCPVFYNLRVCGTGMKSPLADQISALIAKHGGSYSDQMRISATDVLICHGDNIRSSSKYRAVISRRGAAANIRCLSLEWLHDSIKQGHALPEDDYLIHNRSTPITKSNKNNAMDSEMFQISRITDADMTTASCTTVDGTFKYDTTKKDITKSIDLSVLKRARTFLDDCNVYLICITGDDLAFVQRALKYTGATRFDSYTDRVTHVVVGDDKNDANRQELRSLIERVRNQHVTNVVSIRWLVDSMNQQSLLGEDAYSVSMEMSPHGSQDIDGSPLSKKGLKLLRTDTSIHVQENKTKEKLAVSTSSTFIAPDELQQYMQTDNGTFSKFWNDGDTDDLAGVDTLKNASEQTVDADKPEEKENEEVESHFLRVPKRSDRSKRTANIKTSTSLHKTSESIMESTRNDSLTSETDGDQSLAPIFLKKTFQLLQFSEPDTDKLTLIIKQLGGSVVPRKSGVRPYRDVTDYAVVPVISNREMTSKITADHVLTDIWLNECVEKRHLVAEKYYHRCVTEAESKILEGCVVTTSALNSWELRYLSEVVRHMGGITQGSLSKAVHEQRGLLASTHLVAISTTNNKKYDGAKQWGLKTVNARWIEDSLRACKRLAEIDYPVPDAVSKDKTFATPQPVDRTSTKKVSVVVTTPVSYLEVSPVTRRLTDSANKLVVPESLQVPSPALSQLSPESQLSPVSRKHKEVMERVKWRVEHGQLYDSDVDSPSSTRLRDLQKCKITPETPLSPDSAKLLGPNATRAQLHDFLKKIPNNTPPPPRRRLSTPMSELKRQFIRKCDERYEEECQKLRKQALEKERIAKSDDDVFAGHGSNSSDTEMDNPNTDNPTTSTTSVPAHIIDEKMRNFSEILGTPILNNKATKPAVVTPVSGFSELPDSQTYSVGWDYDAEFSEAKPDADDKQRVFSITGIMPSDQDDLKVNIERLGAQIASEQTKFSEITHLLCNSVSRKEKTLCSIASGKWVLHSAYIEESLKAGKFLDEELFEFSNPKCKFPVDSKDLEKARSAVYWRKTVEKTGKGAFHDMRAIVMGNNNSSFVVNIVEAGGGTVIESRPPYENNDYATHCLIDTKSFTDVSELVPLAKCGIYCVPQIYLFNFLINKDLDISKAVLPKLTTYYSK